MGNKYLLVKAYTNDEWVEGSEIAVIELDDFLLEDIRRRIQAAQAAYEIAGNRFYLIEVWDYNLSWYGGEAISQFEEQFPGLDFYEDNFAYIVDTEPVIDDSKDEHFWSWPIWVRQEATRMLVDHNGLFRWRSFIKNTNVIMETREIQVSLLEEIFNGQPA